PLAHHAARVPRRRVQCRWRSFPRRVAIPGHDGQRDDVPPPRTRRAMRAKWFLGLRARLFPRTRSSEPATYVTLGCYTVTVSDRPDPELVERAATEVDRSLLDWYSTLGVIERLRAASRSAAALERLARAASTNR